MKEKNLGYGGEAVTGEGLVISACRPVLKSRCGMMLTNLFAYIGARLLQG